MAGQRVLLALGNRIEFVVCYLGVLRAQVVAVPVNPRATSGELARMIGRLGLPDRGRRRRDRSAPYARRSACSARPWPASRSRVGELDADLLARARPCHGLRRRRHAAARDEQPYDALRAAAPRPVPPLPDPEKLACLLYTSGTSGRPRAAMLTHRALIANIDQAAQVEPPMIHGDDVVLGVLPLFHVYGLNAVLGSVLRRRAKLVLVARFEPAAPRST